MFQNPRNLVPAWKSNQLNWLSANRPPDIAQLASPLHHQETAIIIKQTRFNALLKLMSRCWLALCHVHSVVGNQCCFFELRMRTLMAKCFSQVPTCHGWFSETASGCKSYNSASRSNSVRFGDCGSISSESLSELCPLVVASLLIWQSVLLSYMHTACF